MMFTKADTIKTLTILFNLDAEASKDLANLSAKTLEKLFNSYCANAREYQNVHDRMKAAETTASILEKANARTKRNS